MRFAACVANVLTLFVASVAVTDAFLAGTVYPAVSPSLSLLRRQVATNPPRGGKDSDSATSSSNSNNNNNSSSSSSSNSSNSNTNRNGTTNSSDSPTYSSLLEQPNGRINRDLAERLYRWEHTLHKSPDGKKRKNSASASFSTRQGIRLVQELVQEYASDHNFNNGPASGRSSMRHREDMDDLIQEGIMALMQAKAEYNAGFEEFARNYIRNALAQNRMMNEDASGANPSSRPSMRPISVESTILEVPQVGSTLEDNDRRFYSFDDSDDDDDDNRDGDNEYSIDNSQTNRNRRKTRASSLSPSSPTEPDVENFIDPVLQFEGEDTMWIHQQHVSGMLGDMIPDKESTSTDDDTDIYELVQSLMATLSPQEHQVIASLYGLEGLQPASVIAESMGITIAEVKKLQVSALQKLRQQAKQE